MGTSPIRRRWGRLKNNLLVIVIGLRPLNLAEKVKRNGRTAKRGLWNGWQRPLRLWLRQKHANLAPHTEGVCRAPNL